MNTIMSIRMRLSAICLALLMAWEIAAPTVAYAMGGGPSQPEVQGFQAAGADNMVDLFTGDLSYNIPLMDVEGYPINLFYKGGVTMDQEASWVGLGWNINPGVVDRTVRGIPDDFNGDGMAHNMNLRTNLTVGVNAGVTMELLGEDANLGLGLSLGASFSLNNYNGFRCESDVGLSLRSAGQGKSAFTAGLGLSSSSHGGLRLQPKVGFEAHAENKEQGTSGVLGFNVGLSIDSRKGMTDISAGIYQKMKGKDKDGKTRKANSTLASSSYSIGQSTYTPQVSMPMSNESISLNFTVGGDAATAHPGMRFGGFVSRQQLSAQTVSRRGYGYLYLQNGESDDQGILDINREKNGPYDPDQAALPIANLTNDIYSVSGQGVSGSYRPFRSQLGVVRDEYNSCSGGSGSLGLEVGAGGILHGGSDVLLNFSNNWSGKWSENNYAAPRLRFRSAATGTEGVYFREANEPVVDADDQLFDGLGGSAAMRFQLEPQSGHGTAVRVRAELSNGGAPIPLPAVNHQHARQARSQIFSYLTNTDIRNGLGLQYQPAGLYTNAPATELLGDGYYSLHNTIPGHHIGEVSITSAEGARYVYGLPAYNMYQEDVTFAIGTPSTNDDDELINYASQEASLANHAGKDHYYSKSITPSYAYSYLLTSIVGSDYSDIDGIKGPSDGDLGSYTKFDYKPMYPNLMQRYYSWRTPAVSGTEAKARYDRGLRAVISDDKASYSYGEKEVFYLRTIQSKNRIAVFDLDDSRLDARAVNQSGTMDATRGLACLRSISLYDKAAYLAWVASTYDYTNQPPPEPIMQVHFVYDYLLCEGTPNSAAPGQKKLTLTKVYFTYGGSHRGVTTPYTFDYGNLTSDTENPDYDLGSQDRWGMVKPDHGSPMALALSGDPFGAADYKWTTNSEFPYAEQNEGLANALAGAWSLKHVGLPSGGSIDVAYEADDYAFVQNRPACRMMRIVGTELIDNQPHQSDGVSSRLYFEIPESIDPNVTQEQMLDRMFKDQCMIYFRQNMHLSGVGSDYVSGYAELATCSPDPPSYGFVNAHLAYVDLKEVSIDDGADGGDATSPLKRAALQYARLNYPEQVYAPPGSTDGDDLTADVIAGIASDLMGFVDNLSGFFEGPNADLADDLDIDMVAGEGWLRLVEPTYRKKGGGHRVSRIAVNDSWGEMGTSEGSESRSYVQVFDYTDVDGITSSGVAAYEPMSGADENPMRQPVYDHGDPASTLATDERFYQEEPFGESYFPGAVVGYSRVTVHTDVADPEEQGTGRVVNEFYTAKDFPVRTDRTGIQQIQRGSRPTSLSLIGIDATDYMYTSQGFTVETNDMHGKPKAVTVYPQGTDDGAVSSITYEYLREEDGSLRNEAQVIRPDGTYTTATIGRQHDMVADMREFGSESVSGGVAVNLELVYIGILVLPIPPILPKFSKESIRYRSSVLVKHIQRFGLLKSVTKMDHGSTISTENVAYDAETGRVLLTRSENEYRDPVFTMEFPAYWYYRGMGPAYRNVGMEQNLTLDATGTAPLADAPAYFAPGDVVQIGTGSDLGWVAAVDGGSVRLIDDVGEAIDAGSYHVRVIRSGYRNMQGMPMMTLTTLTDPLPGLATNMYANVLQAKAVEFRDHWRSDCACTESVEDNVFRDNRSGAWRLSKEWVWLAQRSRSLTNDNTDIRRDGVFRSFAPLYQLRNGKWVMDPAGWTTSREVTQYASNGQVQEERDALEIFSSASYSHAGTLMNAKAVNANHKEIGFDSFEAVDPANCADHHFRFTGGIFRIEDGAGHTGRRFLRVGQGKTAEMSTVLRACAPVECNYELTTSDITNGKRLVATGGGLPVTFEPTVIEGSPLIVPIADGIEVTSAASDWEVRVVMRGSDGCPQELTLQP